MKPISFTLNQCSKQKPTSNGSIMDKKSPFFKPIMQPKLTINQPNDMYEQEADVVADKVMRMSNEPQQNNFFFKPAVTPIQRKCAHCEEEERLQKKEEARHLQKKEKDKGSFFNSVENKLASCKGSGVPLSEDIRHQMESSFNTDFSKVRIHTNSTDAELSEELNAKAFTHGSDIYFSADNYKINSNDGKHLLAHELTHTIQQGKSAQWSSSQGMNKFASSSAQQTNNNQTTIVNTKGGHTSNSASSTSIQRQAEEEEERHQLQRKELNSEDTTADSELNTYVDRLSGVGQPLSKEVRNFFEPKMGYNFSEVKVHTDAGAVKSAQAINALAYTSGSHIVFNNCQYAPGTESGKRLIGHELAHVIQQGRGIQNQVQRDVVEPREACPVSYHSAEVATSHSEAGVLPNDVMLNAGGELLIADFGVDWRHVKDSTKRDVLLNEWLARFNSDSSYHLRVVGFSDCVGESVDNTMLRQSRARNIEHLLGTGARSRVSFSGAASTDQYVEPNNSIVNRAKNRGVIIYFTQVFDMEPITIEVSLADVRKSQALQIANTDCQLIRGLYAQHRLDAIGLFLQIYQCLTCSFVNAIQSDRFRDPLWVARVNQATFRRLRQALVNKPAEYQSAMAPCDILDECTSSNMDVLTSIGCSQTMQGTGPLTYLQLCTEGVGRVHLLTDLREALREIGCSSEDNMIDFRDRIVPLFERCNEAILSDSFPVIGGTVARRFAIPQIHELRDQAWSNAGCHPYQ